MFLFAGFYCICLYLVKKVTVVLVQALHQLPRLNTAKNLCLGIQLDLDGMKNSWIALANSTEFNTTENIFIYNTGGARKKFPLLKFIASGVLDRSTSFEF